MHLATALRDDDDETVRSRSLIALSMIGRSAIPSSLNAYKVANDHGRARLMASLIRLYRDDEPALNAAILSGLSDQSSEVRRATINSIRGNGAIVAAVPELTRIAKDVKEPADLRAAAALALGTIGPEASPATPVLDRVLRDQSNDLELRTAAISSLPKIAPANEGVKRILASTVTDSREALNIRTSAAVGLASLVNEREFVTTIFLKLIDNNAEMNDGGIESDGYQMRLVCVHLISSMPVAKKAVPTLLTIAKDAAEELEIRSACVRAIGKYGVQAKEFSKPVASLVAQELKSKILLDDVLHALTQLASTSEAVELVEKNLGNVTSAPRYKYLTEWMRLNK